MIINIPELISEHPEIKEMTVGDAGDYSVHLLRSKKGEKVERHHHKDWTETWYIIEGEYYVEIGNEDFIAKVGDIIQIPKNTIHMIETESNIASRIAIFKSGVEIVYE